MKIYFGKEEFEANDISLGKIRLNDMSLGDIDLSEVVEQKEVFDGIILNISVPEDNFELNLFDYIGGSDIDDAIIDWDDGSNTITIDPSTSALSHTYYNAGDYQLKIKGTIKWKGKYQASATSSLSKCLTSIELPTNNSPIVDIGQYGFTYFNKLTSISARLFDKCTTVTNFSHCFYNCRSLQSIPKGLFDKCTEVTDFSYCFRLCLALQSMPNGLFDNCTKVINFEYCFYDCESLQSIPEGLFDNCPEVTNFSFCFQACSSLQSIPDGLFDNNTKVTNFYYCFRGCSQLQAIPDHLFDNCVEATNLGNCFSKCSNLQSIPDHLFDNNTKVTNFGYCFSDCPNLQSIPKGLFDNNTKVTNFSYCFKDCSSLQTIPNGLFDNCTKVTNFGYCFRRCTSLQSIPEGLFDKCTKVTNFNYCFYDCKAVTSNLPALWISHSTAAHTQCFNSCNKAPNYPEAYAAGWSTSPKVTLTLNTLQDNQLIDLSPYIKPIEDNTEIEIEWGDDSVESIDANNVQHTYENKGEYVVEIYGNIEWVEPRARMIQAGWNIKNVKTKEFLNNIVDE